MKILRLARPFFCTAILLLAFAPARATHIVGGEFKLTYVRDETYNLGLTLYFDDINGSQGALDEEIRCNIFEKSTGRLMDSAIMVLGLGLSFVQYENLTCLGPQPLRTRVLRYNKNITLSQVRYTSPQGYYVVWERCCRNRIITNILDPGSTGQAFYLEFPAVTRNGRPFRNSSPQNFQPVAALGCVGRPFSYDFSGTDPDGDLVLYTMTTPLAGNSDSAAPGQYPQPIPARPGPYRGVEWAAGYSLQNQIGRSDPLRVGITSGQLTFTPDRQGLFVFAVRAEERRNGEVIGVVQREFQLLVIDCPFGSKPDLTVRVDSAAPPLTTRDTITIERLGGPVCLPLLIADTADTQSIILTSPNIPSRAMSLQQSTGNTPNRNNPMRTRLCIDPCPGLPLPDLGLIRIVTRDRTCPQPLTDTAEFYVRFPPIEVEGRITEYAIRDVALPFEPADTLILYAGDTIPLDIGGVSTDAAIRLSLQAPGGSLYTKLDSTIIGDTIIHQRYTLIAACEPDTNRMYRLVYYLQALTCDQTFYLDTLTIPVVLKSRQIDALLTVYDSSGHALTANDELQVVLGREIRLTVEGQSINTNRLPELDDRIARTPASTTSFVWNPTPGIEPRVQGEWRWTPLCPDTLEPDSVYRLTLLLHLVGCPEEVNADFPLRIAARDKPAPPILIPNVLTLNGDSINEAFLVKEQGDKPLCSDPFERMDVYNRWGRRMYSSTRSDFRWAPEPGQSGTYHYVVRYGRKRYKGWVEVVTP